MASFQSKFQILGVKSSKESGRQLLKKSSILNNKVRSFWFLKSKDKPVEYGHGNCGKPLPPCMDIICKDCPSKCLEYKEKSRWKKWFSFKRQPVKEKPSNCKKVEKPQEVPLTWWESIFGPDPKRSWPDPCTCRVAHRERKKRRQYDPRLSDKRYQQTAGDVLLYTETTMQRRTQSCMEPQPKSPPGYRMPKAVIVRMMSIFADKAPLSLFIPEEELPKSDDDTITAFRIPYEELRPPKNQRSPFICQRGISPEDVEPPINRDLNPYRLSQQQTIVKSNLLKNLQYPEKKPEITLEDKLDIEKKVPKRSRLEQLKVLIAEKDMPECSKPPTSK
ncbi:hypothetical protein ANTPLA_LOCUS5802 [Anthophora plagiata]